MKTKKQKETNEKEVHWLEQKGYERMVNESVPVLSLIHIYKSSFQSHSSFVCFAKLYP